MTTRLPSPGVTFKQETGAYHLAVLLEAETHSLTLAEALTRPGAVMEYPAAPDPIPSDRMFLAGARIHPGTEMLVRDLMTVPEPSRVHPNQIRSVSVSVD